MLEICTLVLVPDPKQPWMQGLTYCPAFTAPWYHWRDQKLVSVDVPIIIYYNIFPILHQCGLHPFWLPMCPLWSGLKAKCALCQPLCLLNTVLHSLNCACASGCYMYMDDNHDTSLTTCLKFRGKCWTTTLGNKWYYYRTATSVSMYACMCAWEVGGSHLLIE